LKSVVYEEWVAAGTLVKALVGFFSLLIMCILLITIVVGLAIQHPFLIIVLSSVVAFDLFLFWNYKGIRIQVSNKKLLINYGIFNRKSIPLEDIISCETIKASFGRYGGIGVRYGIDGSWAYTTSFGNAVKIILRRGRPFVFSSNNPEKICNIINQTKNVPHTQFN
jgi:hypothetical protein